MPREQQLNVQFPAMSTEVFDKFSSEGEELSDLAEELGVGDFVVFRRRGNTGKEEVLTSSPSLSKEAAATIVKSRDQVCSAVVCSPDKKFNICFLSKDFSDYAVASQAFWILFAAQSQKEARWVTRLLDGISLPLSTDGDLKAYVNRLCETTCLSLSGKYAVVRERSLVGSYAILGGYDRDFEISNIDYLPDISKGSKLHTRFEQSFGKDEVEGGHRVLRLSSTNDRDVFEEIRSIIGFDNVSSTYTVPLTVGLTEIGFLSVAFQEDKIFSELEETAIVSVGNHIAAAIDAFKANEAASRLREMKLREFIENINAELIHGFRHAARNSLHSARIHYSRLERRSSKFDNQSKEIMKEVRQDLDETSHAIENMGNLRSFNNDEFEKGKVDEVFDDAISMIENWEVYKDTSVNIKRSVSKTPAFLMQKTSLIYAFANLILNSLQGFGEFSGGNRKNEISFTCASQGDRVVVRYSDNGPGLRLGRGDIQSVDDIWLPGKTSKKEGTGYGLPMVREVVQRLHGGSINLKSSRGGMLFEIEFPT